MNIACNCRQKGRTPFTFKSKVQFQFHFQQTHNCSTTLRADLLCRISPRSVRNNASANKISFTPSSKVRPSMSRLPRHWHLFENFRKGSPHSVWRKSDIMSPGQTDRQSTGSAHKASLIRKKRPVIKIHVSTNCSATVGANRLQLYRHLS